MIEQATHPAREVCPECAEQGRVPLPGVAVASARCSYHAMLRDLPGEDISLRSGLVIGWALGVLTAELVRALIANWGLR